MVECSQRRRRRRRRYVRLYLVPDEFEFGDEFARVRRRRGVLVHGVDEGSDVAAFGFCARETVLLFPRIPFCLLVQGRQGVSRAQRTTSLALVATGRRILSDTPLCRRRRPLQSISAPALISFSHHVFLPSLAQDNVPMACLYNPYKRNLVAEGGFCDPVRILFTVLSAWLNTRSTTPHMLVPLLSRPKSGGIRHTNRVSHYER